MDADELATVILEAPYLTGMVLHGEPIAQVEHQVKGSRWAIGKAQGSDHSRELFVLVWSHAGPHTSECMTRHLKSPKG